MTTLPQTTTTRLPRPVGQAPITVAGPIHSQGSAIAGSGAGMTAGDVWRVIRANTWLLVGGAILSAIIGYGVFFLLNRYAAEYTARGAIQMNPVRVANPLRADGVEGYVEPGTMAIRQRTHAAQMRYDSLWTRFLQNGANVKGTDWYKQFIKTAPQADGTAREIFDMAQAKLDLGKNLSIVPIPDTELIEVSMTWRQPKDCRIIVEDLINQYITEQSQSRSSRESDRSQTLSALKNQLTFRQQTLNGDLRQLQSDLTKAGVDPAGRLSPKQIELDNLMRNQSELQSKFADAQGEYSAVMQAIQSGESPPMVDAAVDHDQQVMSLQQRVDDIEIQLKQTRANNPNFSRYQDMLDAAQLKLDERTAELKGKYTNEVRDRAVRSVQSAQKQLEDINERISKMKEELGDLDYKMVTYMRNLDEDKAIREQLKDIDVQLRQILAGGAQGAVLWGPRPESPDLPSFPKRWVCLSVAISCGLMLCLGIAFARELLDTTVRSPRDITRVGQMNLLGMIPHEDDDPQSAGVPLPLVIAQAPTSVIAEQFRQVRTRLQHAAALDTTRSILVTSPGPQDGKTTVATNLAAGLALNGRKILLVDANFKRPELHKIFKLDNNAGFSTVLGSIDSFQSAVSQTQVPNLDVMGSGPKPANPTELLESQLLVDFIEKALEEYDHVIFDSGPMLLVAETVALAPRVDGVVTAVRARTNSRGLLTRLRDELRKLKAEHLGVVLNAVRSQGGGYYGRNIKAYYEYQNGHSA